jgi:hypothetical protein
MPSFLSHSPICNHTNHHGVVLATGPGNLPAVQFLPCSLDWFGSLSGQKPEQLPLCGFVTRTGHTSAVFRPASHRTAVPTLQFLPLCLQLSLLGLIVSDQYIECAVLATLSPPTVRFAI